MSAYLLSVDQGTTNSRAMLFDEKGVVVAHYDMPLAQFFPEPAWVEQNPEEIFLNTVECCKQVIQRANISAKDVKAIGISNQRETTILWDKLSGEPIYPAIVWQDRRTDDFCQKISKLPIAKSISEKTGLRLDPYFSATKIMWLLDHVPLARKKAQNGELLFGTVDTYLLWKLTGKKSHATDATNASRTLLFNIHTKTWDEDILKALDIPKNILPKVLDSGTFFGETDLNILGEALPILGILGDQQAATFGQCCFHPGMIKMTYGTGGFMLLNTGEKITHSKNQLLSTIAYQINHQTTYGLEGSVFSAGTSVKWLRDQLKIIKTAAETEELAKQVNDTAGVYLVPAFTGLGAPYWDAKARGALLGLTSKASLAHVVRAALESVAYQTRDLLDAMVADSNIHIEKIRVDGGMVQNNWLLQFIADILNCEVERPVCAETSALGVAFLAGLQAGVYQSLEEISTLWKRDAKFSPKISSEERERLYQGWKQAVKRILSSEK